VERLLQSVIVLRDVDVYADAIDCCFSTAICPLGRDRTYRRYWVFRSIPGLFVEDNEQHVPDDCFEPCDQLGPEAAADSSSASNKDGNDQSAVENAVVNSEENETAKNHTLAPDVDSSSTTSMNNKNDDGQVATENAGVNSEENDTAKDDTLAPAMDNDDVSGQVVAENAVLDSLEDQTGTASTSAVMTVHEQIAARNSVRWSMYIVPDDVDRLVAALNPRGIRESALKQIISDQSSQISDFISRCDIEAFRDRKPAAPQLTAEPEKVVEQKIEKSLREALLDLEERIFTGNLGNLKVIVS